MCSHLGGTNLWLSAIDALDEVKARASCERGSHGRCFDRDTMGRAQGRLNHETWWRHWCSVELRAWDRSANETTTGTAETGSGIHVLGMVIWGATEVPMRRERRLSIQRVIGLDAPKKELCERELGGCICKSGTVWKSMSRYILKQGGAGLGTRREGCGEDASLEELGERELRGGIGERDFYRVSSVAGGLRFTKVFMMSERNNTTAETPRWRVAWGRLLW